MFEHYEQLSDNLSAYVEFLSTFVVGLLPVDTRKELLSNSNSFNEHVTVSDEAFALLNVWNIEDTFDRVNQETSENVSVCDSFKNFSNNRSKVPGSENKVGWNEKALKKYQEVHRKVKEDRKKTKDRTNLYTQVIQNMRTSNGSKSTKNCKKVKKIGFFLGDDVL